jgi:hypothetical protein
MRGQRIDDGVYVITAHVGEGLAREVHSPQVPLELAVVCIATAIIGVKIE